MSELERSICLVLHAEKAGGEVLREALAALRAQGVDVEVLVSAQPGAARQLAADAARGGAERVVAGGGDGTLNEVVNGVYAARASATCAIGVLPLGTANDFATACGIPSEDPLAALDLALRVKPTLIDVGRMNDRLFVNAASGGYGAEVTAGTPTGMKNALGGVAYFVNGIARMAALSPRQARLVTTNVEWEGPLVAFTVGNGRRAGGGVPVAPEALLDDGLLDVVLFPEVSLGVVADLVGSGLRPLPGADYEHLVTGRVSWLELHFADPVRVNLDGESIQDTSFCFEVGERSMLFCLPPEAPLTTPR